MNEVELKKEWFEGALAVIKGEQSLGFVVYFADDLEVCFRFDSGSETCEQVLDYVIIRDDVNMTLEFELNDDNNVTVVHSIECDLHEGS